MSASSDPRYVEIEADSVEEAIQEGLETLSLSRAEVSVEVLDEGGRGMLGIGGRKARVRLTEGDKTYAELFPPEPEEEVAPARPKEEERHEEDEPEDTWGAPTNDDEEVRVANEVLQDLLDKLQVQAATRTRQAKPSSDETDAPWVLDIQGDDLGVLIGRRGETLNALQYIMRLIASREMGRRINVVVDVQGYKSRRELTLRRLAQRMAEEARHRNRTVKLEPMPPHERRIIHLALRDDPNVRTESEGAGDRRKVTIIPAESE